MLKLNDPKRKAHKAERIEVFRSRARVALLKEKAAFDDEMLDGLAYIAWKLEGGGMPSIRPIVKRLVMDLHNRVTDDASRISTALNSLESAIDGSVNATQSELIERLKEKGIDVDDVTKMINALADVADEMRKDGHIVGKQGNTQETRSAWAIEASHLLHGLKPTQTARIIATVFDGTDEDTQNIRQAIRNHKIR